MENQPFSRQKARYIRESTISPIIKSITEFNHNGPLFEERQPRHLRGRSESNEIPGKSNILFKLGNLDDALKKAQNLLDNKPKDEKYLYLKGRVLEKLGRTNEAEK
jgi:tetratricopeptide (TPR) repeat protein